MSDIHIQWVFVYTGIPCFFCIGPVDIYHRKSKWVNNFSRTFLTLDAIYIGYENIAPTKLIAQI